MASRAGAALLLLLALTPTAWAAPVRVLLGTGPEVRIEAEAPVRLGGEPLPAGTHTLTSNGTTTAQPVWRVYSKSFAIAEESERADYMATLRAEHGLEPAAELLGKTYATAAGTPLDCREAWIRVGAALDTAAATALQDRLKRKEIWAWKRPVYPATASGTFAVGDARFAFNAQGTTLTSDAPFTVSGLASAPDERFAGVRTLTLYPAPAGLHAVAALPVEEYLRGVVPAEMPALWPTEALKAQAIAARSDVYAHWGKKHHAEPWDYTATELSRAFRGSDKWHPASDAAVAATAETVLTDGTRIVPAVFSAVCGGHTENNDTAWSGPPDPNLRGIPDYPLPHDRQPGDAAWINNPPDAYCATARDFRWTARVSARALVTGRRGVSGRLHWVRHNGETIHKDYPIRVALGRLHSTLFTVSAVEDGYLLHGGGRGHGVGLCQWGARGRALAGQDHAAMLRQYYGGATLVRLSGNDEG